MGEKLVLGTKSEGTIVVNRLDIKLFYCCFVLVKIFNYNLFYFFTLPSSLITTFLLRTSISLFSGTTKIILVRFCEVTLITKFNIPS